jgi:tripartite-type tricarboxylate transporter receptor subunit TctC
VRLNIPFHFLKILTLIAIIFSFMPMSYGQSTEVYPSRSITFVVPYTTGSTADLLARNIGNFITQKWKVPVVVDNRSGAAGIIGTDFVAKSANDGYTFLFTATSHASVPAIKNKLPYDPMNGFTPIILLCTSAMGIVINPNLPFQQFADFEAYVKAHPNAYSYSSPGTGTKPVWRYCTFLIREYPVL